AGAARCRLVDHRRRDALPAGVLPVLPDPRRGGTFGHDSEGRMTAKTTDKTLTPPPHTEPTVFTRDQLDWLPWLEPMAEAALTPRHMTALVDPPRAKSDYFRLLARDPDILEARTRTDKDIFYNTVGGAPRADRELAAAATSRLNGCIYCA